MRRGARAVARLVVAAALAAGAGCDDREPEERPAAASAAETLRADSRIQAVLRCGVRDSFYERNLSDPVPVLIDKLGTGQNEPMRRAREELGALGARAVPALRREVEAAMRDAAKIGPLQNLLGALSLNDDPSAAEPLMQAIGHPQSTIRLAALRGLAAKESLPPETFERLQWSATAEVGRAQVHAAEALLVAEPVAAAYQFVDFLERDYARDAWPVALLHLAAVDEEDLVPRLDDLARELPQQHGVYLIAGRVRRDAPGARENLAEALSSADPAVRDAALTASLAAGLVDVVAVVAREDPFPGRRLAAVAGLGTLLTDPRAAGLRELTDDSARELAEATLRGALDDADRSVRDEALAWGVRLGEPEAVERALGLLDGSQRDLQLVARALQEAMRDDPALADRAYERLARRLEAEAGLPLAKRLPVLQVLALVPKPEAARDLILLGREASEPLETISAHERLAIEASNTGPQGRAWIVEALETERDPIRRIDLLWAIGSPRDDFARETLEVHVEREEIEPLERLYAAWLLAQAGPLERAAPRLKRVAVRMEGEARLGMNRLLWFWY